MTLVKPYLFLRRLVIVSHAGGVAYDEKFHRGVNIIRGRNSSGKSTIANFIFYSLGGEYVNWTTKAKGCREIFAEVEINQAVLTLKRAITDSPRQPMSIFWGDYETAIKSNFEGWKLFPYQSTPNKESFSNIVFSALDFPEVRSTEDSKITVHQILRLLYIDQDSPPQNLFRLEMFDQSVTKQAIWELLLGVYDDSLYRDRLSLRDIDQQYQQKKEQFEGINKIFTSIGSEPDIVKVQQEISKTRDKLDKEQKEFEKVKAQSYVNLARNTPLKIEKLQIELSSLKAEIGKIDSEIKDYELDIIDSEQFIETLEKRVLALDDSIATRKVLGELPLKYCPQCLKPLESAASESCCSLCKQPVEADVEKTYAKRLKQEIELQIKESKKLLAAKKNALAELAGRRPSLIEQYRSKQREIDIEERETKTTRDSRLDELLISRGRLENQLEFLGKQIELTQQLQLLRKELQELKGKSEELRQSIALKEERYRANLQKATAKIEALTLLILQKDLDRQAEFKTATSVEINSLRDSFSLDGRNNFSASSNTYFKNAVRFAIFFASLELHYFRFPRFIICDNMEDKGMEQVRTQHFQKVITEISKSYNVEHQIIFTTSMIEPALNIEVYCIGDNYNETNKSLKF